MTCDVCGLPDTYRGQGDGIGSCNCPRCEGGEAAATSGLCTCPPNDPWDGWGYLDDDDGSEPWPDDVILRNTDTIQPSEAYL